MKQYPGYTLVKQEDCPEQHGTLTVLTHDVSGASVLLVENDDHNKSFGIGFGTFPSDDTGVFHILEHAHDDGQHPELPLPGQEERKHRNARVGRDADRDEGRGRVFRGQPPEDER